MKRYAAIMVVLCGILRSSDIFFRTSVVKTLSVLTIITWEHLINLIILSPVLYLKKSSFLNINKKDFLLFSLVGFGASAMGILCFTQAFQYMNPALAVLLQKLQPVITICFGIIFLKERVSKGFIFWALIAICSSYFVSFGIINPLSGEWHKVAKGAVFAILAAFFWGGGTVWGKMLLKKYDQMTIVAGRFLFGFVFTMTLAFTFGNGLEVVIVSHNNYEILTQLMYMAIISGFLATTFFYIGLSAIETAIASILELAFPLSSIAITWIYFDKPLNQVQIVAAIMLFISMFIISRKQGNEVSSTENKQVVAEIAPDN